MNWASEYVGRKLSHLSIGWSVSTLSAQNWEEYSEIHECSHMLQYNVFNNSNKIKRKFNKSEHRVLGVNYDVKKN